MKARTGFGRAAACALLALVSACTHGGGDDVFGERAAIAGGTREYGMPAVVYLINYAGGSCTGTVIAPRVVLTAKHCVQGSGNSAASPGFFEVYVGNDERNFTEVLHVAEVRVVDGCWDCSEGVDVAVLILSSPASPAPLPYARGPAYSIVGDEITAVGFGQTPSGRSGTKYRATPTVDHLQDGYLFVTPSVCHGDSGGPAIGADGQIYGVASFIYSPMGGAEAACGTAPGAYNNIEWHLDFLDQAVNDSGACAMTGDEVCDGIDNNCDEVVDEGCLLAGDACTSSDECTTQLCEETSAGRLCTSTCDPLTPYIGCAIGSFCERTSGCDGLCIPGSAGSLAVGDECEASTECASLLCTDPGDGRKRCVLACHGDAGHCPNGQVCAAYPESCGACVPPHLIPGAHYLGEPCTDAADCESGLCLPGDGGLYCSRACDRDSVCGDGYRCREEHCERGEAEGVGGICRDSADCGYPGICGARGGTQFCTVTCASESTCPDGFDCTDVGEVSVCAPMLALLGEHCENNEACVTGICETQTGTCTRVCDALTPCPASFLCTPTVNGVLSVCVNVNAHSAAADDAGGCNVSPARSGSHAAFAFLMLLAAAALVRRRSH